MQNKKKALHYYKVLLLAIVDFAVLLACGIVSYWIVTNNTSGFKWGFFSLCAVLQVLVFLCVRFYRRRAVDSSLDTVVATFVYMVPTDIAIFVISGFLYNFSSKAVRFDIVYFIFGFIAILSVRFLYRIYKVPYLQNNNSDKKKALIYGAGEIGVAMARLAQKNKFDYQIVGFIDDDPEKYHSIIQGVSVLGSVDELNNIVLKTNPDLIIIAMNTILPTTIQNVAQISKGLGVDIKVVPGLFEKKSSANVTVRDIDYADLLGRTLNVVDKKPIADMVEDKVILVTGAGGSIGSEICKQLMGFHPARLLVLDIDETELHDLCLRLLNYEREWSENVTPILCDIRNREKIDSIFEKYDIDIVFHAAAIKHVPMSELYPEEAILTNICGSYNVLSCAKKHAVSKCVVISTDKAVNPTNAMGATKRAVEMIATTLSSSQTEMVCVRFGNVIGSRGSMLPLFLEEIKAGVPITVTDKRIIRYFMAIPEAVSLVFRAATLAKGSEVMVLDMGEPVKIYDFAQKLIDYFGDGRSTIKVTGLRPGEKLYEELLANKDITIPTENAKIFKAKVVANSDFTDETVQKLVDKLWQMNTDQKVETLHQIVPEWKAPTPPLRG